VCCVRVCADSPYLPYRAHAHEFLSNGWFLAIRLLRGREQEGPLAME
jgi:hypothetical protein